MVAFTICFQCSNGGIFWVYVAEIVEDAGVGLCVFILMGLLVIQSLTANAITNAIGVLGLFLVLGGF